MQSRRAYREKENDELMLLGVEIEFLPCGCHGLSIEMYHGEKNHFRLVHFQTMCLIFGLDFVACRLLLSMVVLESCTLLNQFRMLVFVTQLACRDCRC
jgi:hypothetical protein